MKRSKKLSLTTETVRNLDTKELGVVEGGAYAATQYRCAGGAQTVNDGTNGTLTDYANQIDQYGNVIRR